MNPNSEWLKVYSRTGHYPKAWDKNLIQKIMRDSVNGCELCGISKEQALMDVHHLRHLDKHDCRWENLVVLCRRCHSKLHRYDYHPDRAWQPEWGEFPNCLAERGISPNGTSQNTPKVDPLKTAAINLIKKIKDSANTIQVEYNQQKYEININKICT